VSWQQAVRTVSDFPQPGILFRDILPVLADPGAFRACLDDLEALVAPLRPDALMAPEARGYLLAAPLADRLRTGVVAVRRPGKLPSPVLRQQYALEYGENRLEIEEEVPLQGRRVVVIDDVLATGGTVDAVARLASRVGARVVGFVVLIELLGLQGREALSRWDAPVRSALGL
jgi:adenine phosphoribosyltransferase